MLGEPPLNPRQKAATILVAMGNERAGKLLSHLKPKEIQALMVASEGLQNITHSALEALVEEFEEECGAGVGLIDSSMAFHSLVEEALTPEQLAELNEGPDATQIALKSKSIWELTDKIEDEDLVEFLAEENPNVSAYVITKLSYKRSAAIIAMLEKEARQSIVAAMITTRPALSEAEEMAEEVVTERFGRAIGAAKSNKSQSLVAGMMNELDQEFSDSLFADLADVVESQTLQSVKSLMFRFEDIIHLDSAGRSALFDQVSTDLTTLALRDASPALKEVVLASMGQRTRRMLEAELETPSAAPEEEIKGAQKEIASTVLSLASEGVLHIPTPEELAA